MITNQETVISQHQVKALLFSLLLLLCFFKFCF